MDLGILEQTVLSKIAAGELQTALTLVIEFVQKVFSEPQSLATVFGSERLDQLCLAIGKAYHHSQTKNLTQNKCSVYIASHLSQQGGHTHVLDDTIKVQKDATHIILLTDLFNHADVVKLKEKFGETAEFRHAPLGTAIEKLSWLNEELDKINPRRIFLFNHHEDAVSIAGVQPWFDKSQVIFIHHADSSLCLGVHLPKSIHIDLHNIGYFCCKDHEQLKNNRYLPLIVFEKAPRPIDYVFNQDGELRTCSSGTFNKFSATYNYSYEEMIAERLKTSNGTHLHIGALPYDFHISIRNKVESKGQDPDRFLHIPWVESVWTALIDNKIDLYLSSFPLSGGRASIEAMGSGTPILVHQSSMSRYHGGGDLMYPESFVWKNTIDFNAHLSSLSQTTLSSHAHLSRAWYEKYHSRALMEEQLERICSLQEDVVQPPALRPYNPDFLERFLQYSALRGNVDRVKDQLELLTIQDQQKVQAIREMEASRSWRITAPMRCAVAFLRTLK